MGLKNGKIIRSYMFFSIFVRKVTTKNMNKNNYKKFETSLKIWNERR